MLGRGWECGAGVLGSPLCPFALLRRQRFPYGASPKVGGAERRGAPQPPPAHCLSPHLPLCTSSTLGGRRVPPLWSLVLLRLQMHPDFGGDLGGPPNLERSRPPACAYPRSRCPMVWGGESRVRRAGVGMGGSGGLQVQGWSEAGTWSFGKRREGNGKQPKAADGGEGAERGWSLPQGPRSPLRGLGTS